MRCVWVLVVLVRLVHENHAYADQPTATSSGASQQQVPTGFAGPWRFTVNLGFPMEQVGIGVGRTLGGNGGWRLQGDVGTFGISVAAAGHIQRKLFRAGRSLIGFGIDGGVEHEFSDIDGGGGGGGRYFLGGARFMFERGTVRGSGFAIEAGVTTLAREPFGRLSIALPIVTLRYYWTSGE